MKSINNLVFIFFAVFCISFQSLQAQDFSSVTALSQRVAPWTKNKIVFHSLSPSANERFELITQNHQLHIYASSSSAAATGFNYYLNHFCHQMVSHGADNLKPLAILPEVKTKLRIETPFQYRYALNYVTYNYSMSFYQWKDWEKELDWMALHGVNLMLAVKGTEIIWQKTLQQFGFTDKEIKDFIPGPAFTAWWLMGNLEGWGGPVTDEMINRQMQLQKKILARMKELGIEPILQGFYGMVPSTLQKKYPAVKIVDQGKWAGGFQRPAILSPQDSLFTKMADVYYQNIKNIYGDCKFFGGDLFFEGGNSAGLDVSSSAENIQLKMQKNFPNSTWVLQAWQSSPSKELLKDLQKDKTLVIDLNGESQNRWEKTNAFEKTPWIWCIINNFGEVPVLYGKLQRIVEEPRRALQTQQGKYMKGIGIASEGILNNPLLYDLLLNSAWGDKMDTDSLLHEYMMYRYGKSNDDIYKGLLLLKKTVYASNREGYAESLFAARPAKEIKSVSTWGSRKIFYDNRLLENALKTFVKAAPNFKSSETFQYDITDIARQVLANRGQMAYDSIMKYFDQKKVTKYNQYKKEFLHLLNLQEQLMATSKSCLVGTWLQQAKAFGESAYEKKLAEKNARMQITIWGPDTNPETDLHDYAHKEWAGLLKDLYLQRWNLFFEQLDNELAGKPSKKIDFFAMDLYWAKQQNIYTTIPKGNYLEVINGIISFCATTNAVEHVNSKDVRKNEFKGAKDDFKLSPYTGYTREQWLEITEQIIAGVLPYLNNETGIPQFPIDTSNFAYENLRMKNPKEEGKRALERIMMAVIIYTKATGKDHVPGYIGSISAPVIIGTHVDITRHKNTEEAIRQERILLRTLIDSLPDAIYVKDTRGCKIIASRADVLNIGFSSEAEVIGKTDLELFNNDIGRRGYEDDMRVLQDGDTILNREEYFLDGTGTKRWLLTTKIPVRDQSGRIVRLLGIGHDITARKQSEEELNKLNQELSLQSRELSQQAEDLKALNILLKAQKEQELDKAIAQGKFEIASEVLHDIGNAMVGFGSHLNRINRSLDQNNLDSVKNMALFLKGQHTAIAGAIGAKKAEALLTIADGVVKTQTDNEEGIRWSVTELLNIITHIQEILNIQRQLVRSHQGVHERKPVNLVKIIEDCRAMLFASIEKKGIRFKVNIKPGNYIIKGDPTKLMQVILNILKNSIEAIGIDAAEKKITIEMQTTGAAVELKVTDSGQGFSAETGDLFFVRGFTTKKNGTGLGLYNCRIVVESHAGSLELKSDGPGLGAVTTIKFAV